MTDFKGPSSEFGREVGFTTERIDGTDIPIPIVGPRGDNVRGYNDAAGTRTAVTDVSSAPIEIVGLGPSREVFISPSVRCFIRFGASNMAVAAVQAGNMPIEPGAMFHRRVPDGATHYRVIRDGGSDGFVSVIPVL